MFLWKNTSSEYCSARCKAYREKYCSTRCRISRWFANVMPETIDGDKNRRQRELPIAGIDDTKNQQQQELTTITYPTTKYFANPGSISPSSCVVNPRTSRYISARPPSPRVTSALTHSTQRQRGCCSVIVSPRRAACCVTDGGERFLLSCCRSDAGRQLDPGGWFVRRWGRGAGGCTR